MIGSAMDRPLILELDRAFLINNAHQHQSAFRKLNLLDHLYAVPYLQNTCNYLHEMGTEIVLWPNQNF